MRTLSSPPECPFELVRLREAAAHWRGASAAHRAGSAMQPPATSHPQIGRPVPLMDCNHGAAPAGAPKEALRLSRAINFVDRPESSAIIEASVVVSHLRQVWPTKRPSGAPSALAIGGLQARLGRQTIQVSLSLRPARSARQSPKSCRLPQPAGASVPTDVRSGQELH